MQRRGRRRLHPSRLGEQGALQQLGPGGVGRRCGGGHGPSVGHGPGEQVLPQQGAARLAPQGLAGGIPLAVLGLPKRGVQAKQRRQVVGLGRRVRRRARQNPATRSAASPPSIPSAPR